MTSDEHAKDDRHRRMTFKVEHRFGRWHVDNEYGFFIFDFSTEAEAQDKCKSLNEVEL